MTGASNEVREGRHRAVDHPSSVAAPVRTRPARFRRRLPTLLAMLWIPVAIAVQLLRSSHTPVWDMIWAEDGRFFYGEAWAKPASSTVFEPLAGYLQVAPRVLAELATQLPLARAAQAISVLSAGTAALLSVYVFVAGSGRVPRLWQRLALAALVVLHPAAAFEVNAAMNNVHWYLLYAALWASLSTGRRPARIAADVVVVLLATTSDPLAGLLVPIVLIRLWRLRRSPDALPEEQPGEHRLRWRVLRSSPAWTAAAFVVGLGLQYVLVLVHGTPTHGTRRFAELPILYGYRVAGSFFLGDAGSRAGWDAFGAGFALMASVVVVTWLVLGAWLATRPERRLLLVLALYSPVFFAATFGFRGVTPGLLGHPAVLTASRYTIVPLWLLYSASVVTAEPVRRRVATLGGSLVVRSARLVPVLAVGLIAVQLALNFAPNGPRTAGPSWRQQVAAAKPTCTAGQVGLTLPSSLGRGARPVLVRPGLLAIPVEPGNHLFWAARFACSSL